MAGPTTLHPALGGFCLATIEVLTAMRPLSHKSGSFAFLPGFLILLLLPLVGCNLVASKQAATPPPPKPAAVQPPAPEPPLSIPQTAVTLPSPQDVSPDAIPATPVVQVTVPEKTEPPPAPKVSRRASTGQTKQADAESEPETPPAPAPAVQEQPAIKPILSAEDQRRIQKDIEQRRRQISEKLGRTKAGGLSKHDQSLVDRITSFLSQCDQAEKNGDYSQADALSERALILAQELQVE
jgi:hypothetical protein